MIVLVVGDNQILRRTHMTPFISSSEEVIVIDDTQATLADLEQYLYPSLFTFVAPVIHMKYALGTDTLETSLLKRLLASPTVFMFEEIEVPVSVVNAFKKAGAVVHTQEKIKRIQTQHDIFAVTDAITAADKKKRWFAYRDALSHHAIEAIVGILYWKVRDLSMKVPSEKKRYVKLYRDLLSAHARAWESGAPLELMIEKVVLSQ